MTRAFILVLDSLGIGGAPDADRFGDQGANTLGHIAEACAAGRANRPGLREGPLSIPNLCRLGLGLATEASSGTPWQGTTQTDGQSGGWGYAQERSLGKDTPSGHWEMAGVPVLFDWGYFPREQPCFPSELTSALIERAKLPGLLGNKHASGTTIIEELGDEHVATGKPIVYTSADSVFQIAAHEDSFGLGRLYDVCETARVLVDRWNIGRVIARPFVGEAGAYTRTGNRRDYATPPPEPTLLDHFVEAGGNVIAIGKVSDIFAHQGISSTVKAHGNAALMAATLTVAEEANDRSLVVSNFVDFDTLYGHRRDVAGYAAALEAFDLWLPKFEKALQPGDLAVITADHGCDATWPGSDHTRENVPVVAFGPDAPVGPLGRRETFADIGQSMAAHLGLPPLPFGLSFL